MKSIATHSPSNVVAVDEVGPGGAHHEFLIKGQSSETRIQFQKGPRREAGSVEGIFTDDLLAIVETTLMEFQEGPYACGENAEALAAVSAAREAMARRVSDRAARGVLGKNAT
jgi:hypothetical protein